MSPKLKLLLDLADLIKQENTKSKNKIPTSDTFLKQATQYFSRSEEEIRGYLATLRDFKYIFIINIVQADMNAYIPSIDAYLFADPLVIADLKRYADQRLEQVYESTFYKRKSSFQITRELFSRVKEFNNTPLGKEINIVIMIEEFGRFMNSNPYDFSESTRKDKIFREFQESEEEIDESAYTNSRAADVLKKNLDINPNSKWGKAVTQFSIEFLVRIHFRKYEFETIKRLINSGKIKEEKDLIYVRNTLKKMEGRTEIDTMLKHYMGQMTDLRRLAQAKLNIMRKVKPNLG